MARSSRLLGERNTESAIQVLPTRVKGQKAATNGARRDKGKRRAEEVSEDEDERDQHDEEDEDEQGGSPKGRKRVRANTDGDARPGNEEIKPEPRKVETMPRDVDGYIPGSIIRIQLMNFVTYDFTEFRLGPYLNMIIGPNGTGKSTIACAICIGLNWPASTLGRATEVNSFVKQGTKKGYIEIELKGPKGKNLVIRRLLDAASKASQFTLNGINATGNEISNQMAALNVQVGNLCTFLPQDKVSSFAGMSPQQLLKETQRAAGDSSLSEWHQTLIEEGSELRKTQQVIQEEEGQLNQMRERNEKIEREVQRYKERKKIEEEIKLLTVLIPVRQYMERRELWAELKEAQRKLWVKVNRLKEKNAPAHEWIKEMDKKAERLDGERNRKKKDVQTKLKQINTKTTSFERLEADSEDLHGRLDLLAREERARASKISQTKTNIDKYKQELAKDIKIESDDEVNRLMRELRGERQTVTDRKDALMTSIKANADRKAGAQQMLHGKQTDIHRLNDVDVQKMNNLKRYNVETYETVLWLRRNRDKFKMEIIEPAFLTVNVTHRAFAAQLEACFGRATLTFVAQCKEDYDMFNRTVNDTTAVCGRRIRVTAWYRPQMAQMSVDPPMSREELAGLDFNGYALDFITYPEGMLWFLQCDLSLHRIAIGPDKVDTHRAMAIVTRPEVTPANFITGMTCNQITRSRYGKRLAQNMTRGIFAAKTFVASSVDPEVKNQLERELQEINVQLGLIDEEHDELQAKWKDLQLEDKGYEERAQSLKRRKDHIQAQHQKRANAQSGLNRAERELKKLQDAPSAEQERATIGRKLVKLAKDRFALVKEYLTLSKTVVKDQTEAARLGLQVLQIKANIAQMKRLCEERDAAYERAKEHWKKAHADYQEAKRSSKEALEESRRVLVDADPELKARQKMISRTANEYRAALREAEKNGTEPPSGEGVETRSSEELEEAIETQRAQLEMSMKTNPGVMEEYEKRKRDIEVLKGTLETKKKAAERIEKAIKKARDNWEPALRRLVDAIGQKFSEAFDSIGCAGEIRISPNDDYDKWAIDILVKFRDEEKLQLLTGQRQSGGERSLTTILYLMSLTEQARAPFSLVDEINQGMDQRAERLVHNNMVRVTTQDDAGQYFLITPKLLPDLQYHPRMKVLCVNNGEWLPEETGLGNMMDMIEGYVARR